jgi:hypothetical protein
MSNYQRTISTFLIGRLRAGVKPQQSAKLSGLHYRDCYTLNMGQVYSFELRIGVTSDRWRERRWGLHQGGGDGGRVFGFGRREASG